MPSLNGRGVNMKPYREDGVNAGWRNIGRLALWSIPYVLGATALVWLGAFMAFHDFWNILSQEKRRAIYVAAEERPREKIKIDVPNRGPLKITRVDLDGSTASVYFTNSGNQKAWAIQIHWQFFSPDGTALASGYEHSSYAGGPEEMQAKEKAEAVLKRIALDDRAASIRFWISNY
jgi:hypothetical protein